MPVGALEAAEIGALAGPGAGDEERHVRRLRQLRRCRRLLLCVDAGRHAQRQCGNDKCLRLAHFCRLPLDFHEPYERPDGSRRRGPLQATRA